MKNFIHYIALFLLFLCAAQAYSNPKTLRGLSTSDGLPDLLVNALYKDSLGFVWIGTGSSLERFDGIHFRHYPIAGANEKLKRVNAIAEMADNVLWIGNGMGLWRMNREQSALEQILPENIDCSVNALLHDGKGTLYIGCDKGLYIYQDGNLVQMLPDRNNLSAANTIAGLALDKQGTLWMATERGLYTLQTSGGERVIRPASADPEWNYAFNTIANIGDKLYLGTMDQGIIAFDIHSKSFSRYVNVGCNVISSLSDDGKRLLYVGTDGNGVHFIDTEQEKVVRSLRYDKGGEESLRSNSVYSLLVDRDGIVWVGFYQAGLDYTLYQTDLFTTYAYPPYFQSKDRPIRAISVNEDEKLIGTRDGLFYIDEKRKRFKSFHTPEMRSNMVFSILPYQGDYYIGTYGGGMYLFRPKTLTLHEFRPEGECPSVKGHIFCIKQDAEQRIWVGTSQGIYCYLHNKLVAHYTSANSKLPEGNVYELFFDSTHKGWFCTENGLCLWDPSSGTLRTDMFPEGFIHKEKIRVVYENSRHQLYFFPDKGALFISDLTMNSFRRLQPDTPLEGRDGLFIIEDREHWLWIGTNKGLFRYNQQETFLPYTFVDGVPNAPFTLCPPVCDKEGNLWFGNSKGLIYLNQSRLSEKTDHTYPIRITDVYVNGQPSGCPLAIADGKTQPEVTLDSSQKNVTFRFSNFSYTAPTFMTYEYQLEGHDETWQTLNGRSEITYYNLPSGSYRFKVRHTEQPSSEIALAVTIASNNLYAWITAIVLLLLLAGGAIYYRLSRRSQQEASENAETTLETDAPSTGHAAEEKYKSIKVSAEECKMLAGKLEAVMRQEKPYKRPDLKIAELASAIGTSTHTLSYLFNQYLKCNYYDYINDFRIAEFKRLVGTDEYAKYTLSALAELCGFSSRASFFRYFKKATGITPNEYIHSLEKED